MKKLKKKHTVKPGLEARDCTRFFSLAQWDCRIIRSIFDILESHGIVISLS